MLQLDGVTRRFGDTLAVERVDLHVPAAQTTVLLGPSGCGKSTLLRLMIGLLMPDAGQVTLDGEPLTADRLLEMRRRMGYVIQDGGLFPHLTARGNATLMARYVGWSENRCRARLDELSTLTHFPGDALDRYPAQLSGGQRQRVSLMRALMLDPEVLLLDEPLGALDPLIRYELQTDLRRIFAELRKTVVMVTHDLAEAGYFGHGIVLLRGGKIVQQGTLHDLVHRPAEPFAEQFVSAQRDPLAALEDGPA